jgi:hypothetical protein
LLLYIGTQVANFSVMKSMINTITAKAIMLDDLLEICDQIKVDTFEILITAEYEKSKQRID